MNEEERDWRLSLDVGKTIDVFKQDVKKGLEMWTKGEIIAVTGYQQDISSKSLKVSFYMDVSVNEASYKADSPLIAPYGTLSSEQDWRDKI